VPKRPWKEEIFAGEEEFFRKKIILNYWGKKNWLRHRQYLVVE